MVDFDPSVTFLVSASEKKRLKVLQRSEAGSFDKFYRLDQISGIPTSICWVAQDLILVGLALEHDKAKIDIIVFDKTDIQQPLQYSLESLDQHTASVNAIIVG